MKCVISVLGKDRSGIVAAVSRVLAECGANIDDISQTIMNEIFTMTMLVTLDPEVAGFNEVQEKLDAEGEELGVQIILQREDVFQYMYKISSCCAGLPAGAATQCCRSADAGSMLRSADGSRLDAAFCGWRQARCRCSSRRSAERQNDPALRSALAPNPVMQGVRGGNAQPRTPFAWSSAPGRICFFAFISTFANRLSTTSFAGFVIGRVVETCAARRQKGVCGEGAKVCVPSPKKEGGRCAQAAGTHSRPRRPIG